MTRPQPLPGFDAPVCNKISCSEPATVWVRWARLSTVRPTPMCREHADALLGSAPEGEYVEVEVGE